MTVEIFTKKNFTFNIKKDHPIIPFLKKHTDIDTTNISKIIVKHNKYLQRNFFYIENKSKIVKSINL